MKVGYDIAQICINGHVINSSSESYPQYNKKFCVKCGAETITNCKYCGGDIKGYYHGDFINISPFIRPSFCDNCGKPYPWIESRILAAQELAKETKGLSSEDKDILKNSINEIVKDTPSSQVAALRFKNIMVKSGKVAAGMFKDILVEIVSEAAKKVIWGS